ncbi:MAG TPA: hypothetical protein VHQ65_12845 [Thermoanaerobaculia bacterium]|nr:hypothetical protein [Thermoanaerobaculia bacterium]
MKLEIPLPLRRPARGRRSARHPSRLAAALLLALLLASPALAYTIYLKDGSKIVAEKQHVVRDGKAYITLLNGTETFIAASEIDVARTERANRDNYGSALLVEGGEVREREAPPPEPKRRTLGDLITSGEAASQPTGAPARAEPRREEAPAPRRAERTAAGFRDLATYPREAMGDAAASAELRAFFVQRGVTDAAVFRGTEAGRPLVEVTAGSETAVFRALAVAAAAVLHLQEAGATPVLELYLATPSRERAGQFVLDPEKAQSLLAKEVDLPTFYVRNVQF